VAHGQERVQPELEQLGQVALAHGGEFFRDSPFRCAYAVLAGAA
jgi:hypothetical protein